MIGCYIVSYDTSYTSEYISISVYHISVCSVDAQKYNGLSEALRRGSHGASLNILRKFLEN